MTGISRRTLLTTAAAVGAVSLAGRPAAAAATWPAVAAASVAVSRVEGSDARVALLPGDVTTVLLHVARRFSYEVAVLGRDDAYGWLAPGTPGAAARAETGTALTLLPGRLPPGAADGLFPVELLVVRDVLAECEGVVRWGGDDEERHEGAFRLAVPPGSPSLRALAARLAPPGSAVDVTDPTRRRAAEALARLQAR